MSFKRGFRRFVCYMAKPIPGKEPMWPLVLGALGIGLAWTFLPYVFYAPFKEVPIVSNVLNALPFAAYLPYILAYGSPMIMTWVCLMPICRAFQLLDPDEFDPYNDDE